MTEQARYQIRFDWGTSGLAAIADDADVIAWVDATSEPAPTSWPADALVLRVDMASSVAAAQRISAQQTAEKRRMQIAVIAAGSRRDDGSTRFAVEDHLAAGALIDALVARGIDATSPEAAIAENAYRGLAKAAAHLISASAPEVPAAARRVVADAQVVVLQDSGAKSSASEFMQ